MGDFIRFFKSLFGVYEPGYEYWIKLSDIHISRAFRRKRIGDEKYKDKWRFYCRYGYCESRIILNKNFVLTDGYSSYKILRKAEGTDAKVPVYFE